MKKLKKTSVAAKTATYTKAFPPHPNQQEFLDACIALRAKDVDSETTARTEFAAGLQAILFPPPEQRFYLMWSSDAFARLLIHYTQTAWSNAGAKYGDRHPMHYDAKPKVQN
jgi:hypothetical protein